MEITVNGKQQQLESGMTLSELLNRLNLDPERVAVERNLNVVPKDDFANTTLANDDTLEIVQFVGGG